MHNHFIRFCNDYSINPNAPLSEQQLCMAMVHYCRTHKVTSLPNYISALSNWSSSYGLGDLPRFGQFDRVKKGLKNYFGLSEFTVPKEAVSLSDLTIIYAHIDQQSFNDIRDWCCYVFAFFGLFRLRELIGDHFTFNAVQRFDWGIHITIPFSKTNINPAVVKLAQRRGDIFCPLLAYDRYVEFIPIKLRISNSPFFRISLDRTIALTAASYASTLKYRIEHQLLKSPSSYGTHSMRRGGTTALFQAKVPDTMIMNHGRWRSITYQRYFDWASTNQLQPTQLLYDAHTYSRHPLLLD